MLPLPYKEFYNLTHASMATSGAALEVIERKFCRLYFSETRESFDEFGVPLCISAVASFLLLLGVFDQETVEKMLKKHTARSGAKKRAEVAERYLNIKETPLSIHFASLVDQMEGDAEAIRFFGFMDDQSIAQSPFTVIPAITKIKDAEFMSDVNNWLPIASKWCELMTKTLDDLVIKHLYGASSFIGNDLFTPLLYGKLPEKDRRQFELFFKTSEARERYLPLTVIDDILSTVKVPLNRFLPQLPAARLHDILNKPRGESNE